MRGGRCSVEEVSGRAGGFLFLINNVTKEDVTVVHSKKAPCAPNSKV